MGFYLNNKSKVSLYKSEMQRPYFVDKTLILSELFPFVESGNSHICITRPRRFGKTVMANMIGAFFEKDEDTKEIFDQLKISKSPEYEKHRNKHDVIFRRYHLQIVLYMKLSVLKSTFSYIHCLCLLKFSPSPVFATTGLLWLLLTSRHSLLLTDFILCFRPLTRPPLVPHVTFSPYICHIYYS